MALSGVSVFPDGRVVMVGDAFMDGPTPSDRDFVVVRRNMDGTPDTTFGPNGRRTLPFNLVTDGDDTALAAAQGPSGTTYVAGYAQTAAGYDIAVARLTLAGDLDSTFGTGGKVTINVGPNDSAHGIAVLPDGGVVLAAEANQTATLFRLESDGDPFMAFGGDGSVETAVGGTGADTWNRIILTGDKIVAGGTSNGVCVMLGRFNLSDGTLDSTFEGGGVFFTPAPSGTSEQMSDLTKAGDGTLLLSGSRVNPSAGSIQGFARSYNADGGFIRLINGPPNSFASGLVAQGGTLILTGSVNLGPPTYVDFFAHRANLDGTPDLSFGAGGTGTYPIGPADADDFANGTALQGDRLIVVGDVFDATDQKPVAVAVQASPRGRCDLVITTVETIDAGSRPTTQMGIGRLARARVTVRNLGEGPVDGATLYINNPDGTRNSTSETQIPEAIGPGQEKTVVVRFFFDPNRHPVGQTNLSAYVRGVYVGNFCEDPEENNTKNFTVNFSQMGNSDLLPLPSYFFTGQAATIRAKLRRPRPPRPVGALGRSPDDVVKVEIALVRLQGGAQAMRVQPACFWLRNARAAFTKKRPVDGKCSAPIWLRMTKADSSTYVFKLRRGLPNGKYVLFSRATNRAGLAEDTFTKADKNRRAFTVRRR